MDEEKIAATNSVPRKKEGFEKNGREKVGCQLRKKRDK